MADTGTTEVTPAPNTQPVTSVPPGTTPAFGVGGLAAFANLLRRPDLGLAFGVIVILVVLILPMPAMMLDFLLAISITFSILILMTCLFIHKPLEFSAFPTVLLIATMLRLSLNLASTQVDPIARPRRHFGCRPGDRGVR